MLLLFFSCKVFMTPWTAARQASLSPTISWSLLKLMMMSMRSSNLLVLCGPLLLLPSVLPSIRVFSMSWLLASGGQRIGASTSVLPMNIQGWFHLGLTGWSPCSPRDSSRAFSSIIITLSFKGWCSFVLQFWDFVSPHHIYVCLDFIEFDLILLSNLSLSEPEDSLQQPSSETPSCPRFRNAQKPFL